MHHKFRVVAVVVTCLALAGTGFTVAHLRSASDRNGQDLQTSMNVDASLRAAARALQMGVQDGSAAWDPTTHTVSSSRLSTSNADLTAATFDAWTATFCVSASNGHRITNTSAGIEHGTCPHSSSVTATPSQETTVGTGGAPPDWVRLCVDADLQLGLAPQVAQATGEHAVIYSVTNRAATQCSLIGFPAVSFHDLAGNVLPFRYSHSGSTYVPALEPHRFKLRPGESGFFIAAQYRCDQGPVMAAATISAKVPGSAGAPAIRPTLIASRSGGPQLAYCKGGAQDPGNVMAITPFSADIASLLKQ